MPILFVLDMDAPASHLAAGIDPPKPQLALTDADCAAQFALINRLDEAVERATAGCYTSGQDDAKWFVAVHERDRDVLVGLLPGITDQPDAVGPVTNAQMADWPFVGPLPAESRRPVPPRRA